MTLPRMRIALCYLVIGVLAIGGATVAAATVAYHGRVVYRDAPSGAPSTPPISSSSSAEEVNSHFSGEAQAVPGAAIGLSGMACRAYTDRESWIVLSCYPDGSASPAAAG